MEGTVKDVDRLQGNVTVKDDLRVCDVYKEMSQLKMLTDCNCLDKFNLEVTNAFF